MQTIDLMPTLLRHFGVAVPDAVQGRPLQDVIRDDTPVRKVTNVNGEFSAEADRNFIFDLAADPGQERPLEDAELEASLAAGMTELLRASDAPREQYERMELV